jgi:hypothetical protein
MAVTFHDFWTHPAAVERRRLDDAERQAWLEALSRFLNEPPRADGVWEIR